MSRIEVGIEVGIKVRITCAASSPMTPSARQLSGVQPAAVPHKLPPEQALVAVPAAISSSSPLSTTSQLIWTVCVASVIRSTASPQRGRMARENVPRAASTETM